ncbi:MAG: cation:proton antiporter [Actinobacteria bacterium]|nr:cation:proton antiporter [Actinomycetota bacterium]
MTLLLGFAVALMLAVLISALAERSVLSTAVVFLACGVLIQGVGIVPESPEQVVELIAEIALFSVLFTDGMLVGIRDLAVAWRLPGRALLLGMPLTLVGTAVAGHYLVGLPWVEAFLLGAALSPTDPVFASAIVGRPEVPYRLRHLLNVESGINDGLALPVVLVLLVASGGEGEAATALEEVALGLVVGVAIPLVMLRLEQSRFFAATGPYEQLNGFAIGLLVYTVSLVTHANLFLAAFAAGVTVASTGPRAREAFHEFGEVVAELFKLAALFVFGTFLIPEVFTVAGWPVYVFALVAVLVVRPLTLPIALAGTGLHKGEYVAASWFGPKGFASVVYGLIILQSDIPDASLLFQSIALAATVSMVLHSSTDVVIADWFRGRYADE